MEGQRVNKERVGFDLTWPEPFKLDFRGRINSAFVLFFNCLLGKSQIVIPVRTNDMAMLKKELDGKYVMCHFTMIEHWEDSGQTPLL